MSAYSKGANFERRVMKWLEAHRWTCFRSAGSHKAADLIALRQGEVRLIQCQIDPYFAPGKREAVIELARENKCQAFLAWREGRKIKVSDITNQKEGT